ncbi:MAG: phosphoribosyltransferase family protein [Candidatus Micrarchaeota archaeon]
MPRENWENKPEYSKALAERVRRSGFRPDIVVAIKRGGTVPGKIIAQQLGAEYEEITAQRPASASGRGGRTIGEALKFFQKPEIDEGTTSPVSNKKVLIVDNSISSGKTTELVRRHLLGRGALSANIRTAALYYLAGLKQRKPPDYYLTHRNTRLFRPMAPKIPRQE